MNASHGKADMGCSPKAEQRHGRRYAPLAVLCAGAQKLSQGAAAMDSGQ